VGRTAEDVSRLPRWARQRIERLTAEIEHLKAVTSAAETGQTNVTLLNGIEERGLPPNARIRFRLPRGRPGSDVLECSVLRGDPDTVEIRSNDGRLVVLPSVSNVIYVKVERQ